ncbi:FAD/NAD(P)-binding domain-containing protein [Teratosphaeria nubilosa]|uniref:FAD/NAD(P)-binding domain-containing protein n=1 Tax=Teratosphaeria nubilosa TaxID=161662 RepID=A0A6G1LB42_9PEZI|nr:FAD/NAD(P)-binding domain-containing protein [Teratosphaeria nubilosa]
MDSQGSRHPFKIAVVGGGIGGLFCSLAIHHHCTEAGTSIDIDVYEQASHYKEIGAGIGVGINAARLYHKLGIGQKLNAVAGTGNGVWITFRRFDNSEEILTLPSDDNAAIRQAPCARSDLLDLLRETIDSRRAATLHTKKALKRVEDFQDRVRLHFADSSIVEANMVIACDGIHSAVRSQFVVDNAIFSGQIAYRGVIPIKSIPFWPFDTYRVAWLAKHRHLLVSPMAANKSLNIVAFVTKSESEVADVKESWTSTCERKDAVDDFAGFDEPAQQVIRLLPEKPSKWKINDRLPLNQWHYMGGKVVLLGDAAHAMLPHLGAGAGQAVEDAWVLGRAFGDFLAGAKNEHFASLERMAQLYQDVRLPRAQKVQRTSRLAGDTYEFQAEDMKDKTLEECIPIMAERTSERMKWVWEEDLDAAYEKARG